MCESSSNMQNEFSLHLPRARERERERGREKTLSFLSMSDPSVGSRENKTAAQQIAAETNAHTKKVLIFLCCSCQLETAQRLLQMTTYSTETHREKDKRMVCFSWRKRSDARGLQKTTSWERQVNKNFSFFRQVTPLTLPQTLFFCSVYQPACCLQQWIFSI